jgi:hypothetical protein
MFISDIPSIVSKRAKINFVNLLAGLLKIPNQLRIAGEVGKILSLRKPQILDQMEKSHINLQGSRTSYNEVPAPGHLFFAPMQEPCQTDVPF